MMLVGGDADGHYPGDDGNRMVLTMGDGVGHGHGESSSNNDTNPGNLRKCQTLVPLSTFWTLTTIW